MQADNLQPAWVSRQVAAVLAEFHGRIALMAPADEKQALAEFERSMAIYPTAENASLCPLATLYRNHGRQLEYEQLVTRYGEPCG